MRSQSSVVALRLSVRETGGPRYGSPLPASTSSDLNASANCGRDCAAAVALPVCVFIRRRNVKIGTQITITGQGLFPAVPELSYWLRVGGQTATTTSWTDTQIVATIPSGLPGNTTSVPIVAGYADDYLYHASSNTYNWTVNQPLITSMSPTSGVPGTAVTLTGSGFGATQGTSAVTFSGANVVVTSWSDTNIVATVPSGTASGNKIGTQITITGQGLFPAVPELSYWLRVGGQTATTTSWTDTQIVATIPLGLPGNTTSVPIVAGYADDYLYHASSNTYNWTISRLNITSLSPVSGSAGIAVTITGTGFGVSQGTSTANFNSTLATPTSWSDTQIIVPVPSGATTGNLVVTVNGVASSGISFTVVIPPSIGMISPISGPIGTAITITGTQFGATQGSSTVSFNGTVAVPTSWSDTQIEVQVPAGATTGNLVVAVSGVASSGVSFAVLPPPSIVAISPTSGSVAMAVTITGTNFGASQGTSAVLFNGVSATPTGWSDTQIVVPVPREAITGPVVVTVSGQASNGVQFTVAGFFPNASLNAGRNGQSAVLLNNGTVLVLGGASNGNSSASAELYNSATVTFTPTENLNLARTNETATLLDNGTVLITGGYDSSLNPLTSAEIYNPATGVFTSTGSMTAARANHTATLLPNGTVLVAGSLDGSENASAAAELYIPATGTFLATGSMNAARGLHSAVRLDDGSVVVIGGSSKGTILGTAELYNPGTGTFTSTGDLNTPRLRDTATLLNSGMVLVSGGQDSSGNVLNSAELYDPGSETFLGTGALNTARAGHAATLLNNGMVLLEGGIDSPTEVSASAEIYDPESGTFNTTASMTGARQGHTATLLTSGAVLVAGGTSNSSIALSSTELYQPDTYIPANLVSIAVNPLSPLITSGVTQSFVATGTFADNTTETLTSVTWGSSDKNILSVTNDVSNEGGALGLAPGSAVLTACTGSLCGSTTVTVGPPIPIITNLSSSSGVVGNSVTIMGVNFGSAQGVSTVTFKGIAATPTSWSVTSIVVPVPAGATTGNVLVTVSGVASNAVLFHLPPIIASHCCPVN